MVMKLCALTLALAVRKLPATSAAARNVLLDAIHDSPLSMMCRRLRTTP
jgi:hypothetical protein